MRMISTNNNPWVLMVYCTSEGLRDYVASNCSSFIYYLGELFKLGMVHEAIIHNCIKEVNIV